MTNISDLEQRIQQLEDQQAILDLKFHYLNACDEKQPEQVLACFAEGEIDIDFGHIGRFNRREDFVALYTELACRDNIVDMHHAQNPVVTLLGPDRARAKVALRFHSIDTQAKTSLQLGGHYLDEFRKDNRQWFITKSHFRVNSVVMSDFSGEYNKVIYTGNSMPA
ncbi:nuclear transport factor 2 family protein [Marinobacter sp. X15-166B]|uniref:nuclear transport factor 2 family protein n=1 Tax=Marinobacter sp. X15-166B TaxID=1897620 RepID=UPI00085CAAD6|nr:nuclear transport factor 2 family protein [Marinobacter sp. X15-166B]OEY66303.1 hypothetical protein BG841_07425 [Marinobacter sp. X15-166B]